MKRNIWVTLLVILSIIPFSNVYSKDTITKEQAAIFLKDNQLLQGDNGNLMLDSLLTREQMVVITSRLLKEESIAQKYPVEKLTFKDVPKNHWAAPYIVWAQSNDIIQGYSTQRFGLGDKLTLWQAKALMIRILGYKSLADKDINEKCSQLKITEGLNINDQNVISRGEMSLLVYNTLYATYIDGEMFGKKLGITGLSDSSTDTQTSTDNNNQNNNTQTNNNNQTTNNNTTNNNQNTDNNDANNNNNNNNNIDQNTNNSTNTNNANNSTNTNNSTTSNDSKNIQPEPVTNNYYYYSTTTRYNNQYNIIVAKNSDTRKTTASHICDGVADDIEIQQAIDAAFSYGGGTVHILSGTYYPKKEIALKSNVTLQMDPGAILKLPDQVIISLASDYTANSATIEVQNSSGFVVGMDIGLTLGSDPGYKNGHITEITAINGNTLTISPVINANYLVADNTVVISHYGLLGVHNANNVTILGGELDGNSSGSAIFIWNADSTLNGIASSDNCSNLTIKDVYVHHMLFQGIHPWGIHPNLLIENCRVENNGAGGIVIDTVPDNVVLVNNIVNNNSHSGVKALVVGNLTIIGGQYNNNLVAGIEVFLQGCKHVQISNVSCKGNVHGIRLSNVDKAVINGGILEDNTDNGILLDSCSNSIVQGVIIKSSTVGIKEQNSDFNTITSNVFESCPTKVSISGDNTIYNDQSPTPQYKESSNTSQSISLPSDMKNNAFKVSIKGRAIENLLGNKGDIALNETEYTNGHWLPSWPDTRPLTIWTAGTLKTIDGYKCIDGFCSDIEWPNIPRVHRAQVNTVAGHKYLIKLMGRGNRIGIGHIDQNTGVGSYPAAPEAEVTNMATWTPVMHIFTGNGDIEIFPIYSVYITWDAGYFKDVMVIDLTEIGDDGLTDAQIRTKYATFDYFNNATYTLPSRVQVTAYEAGKGNLLKDYGNIELNSTTYQNGGIYGPLNIWFSNMVKDVDGFKVLDGYWSDYAWPDIPRSNYIKIPSINGHKYLIHVKTKGITTIEEVDCNTGNTIDSSSRNNNIWGSQFYTTTSAGKDLVFLLRSQYITWDAGYFKDIEVYDLTAYGDEGLSQQELESKYSDSTQVECKIISDLFIPKTLKGFGSISDEVSYNGQLIRRVSEKDLTNTDFDTLTSLTNVDIVTTTSCLNNIAPQTDGIDNTVHVFGKEEIAEADIDNVNSIGKYSTASDGKIKLVLQKGKYADIAAARTGLGTIGLVYKLQKPITVKIPNFSVAIGGPDGTLSFDNAVKETSVYNNGISIHNSSLPIESIEELWKVDTSECKESIDVSNITIDANKLLFTISGAVNGETYEYVYKHSVEGAIPEIKYKYASNVRAQEIINNDVFKILSDK